MCKNYVKTVLHALYSFKILTAEAFFAPKALRFGLFSKDITGSEKDEGEVEFFFCTKCGKKFNTRRQFQAHTGWLHKQILCYKCNLTVGSYPALRLHKKSATCSFMFKMLTKHYDKDDILSSYWQKYIYLHMIGFHFKKRIAIRDACSTVVVVVFWWSSSTFESSP